MSESGIAMESGMSPAESTGSRGAVSTGPVAVAVSWVSTETTVSAASGSDVSPIRSMIRRAPADTESEGLAVRVVVSMSMAVESA